MAYTQQTPVGTPDVNLITKTLAGLQPDSALQQYAMLHKNNPYILSLAKSESDRRKQLRTASQGQVGQQPTVADQSIAGMAQTQLPENQGIAQIPTPNMQGMANGGIAGYEDDEEGMATGGMGGMFNFAQQSEPVVRMADGGHIPRYQGIPKPTGDGSVVSSNPMYNVPGFQAVQPRADFTQAGSPENQTMFERFSGYLGEKKKQATLSEIAYRIHTGIATEDEKAFYQAEMTKKPGQKQMGAPKDVVNPDDVLMANEKASRNKAATADKAAADKVPPAASAPQIKMPTGIATLKEPTAADAKAKASEFYNAADQTRRLEQQQLQERQDIFGQKEARIEQLDAFNQKQGPAYAGYEKLLKSEELQDTTDKEKAGLQALFKGFLAVAAGESPNAATNIAKGSMAGLEEYSGAMKEFKKAAKERNKAMADIENARRAEGRDDFKSQQVYEEKADTRLTESNRLFTNAVMQVTGKEADISSSIFGKMVDNAEANKRTMYTEGAQTARTMATLNAPDPQSKFYGNLGGGDVKKGLAYYAETMGPDAKGLQERLKEYSGMVGEARLKAMETSKDPAERARAATIRQLQKEQMVGGIKPVNVAQDRNLLP
jgi:hypothetical protein